MNVASIIIVAIVAYIAYRCIRSLIRDGGENCAACGSASTCEARITGQGKCVAAEDMLKRVDAAFDSQSQQQ